jgi:hypothetical protein
MMRGEEGRGYAVDTVRYQCIFVRTDFLTLTFTFDLLSFFLLDHLSSHTHFQSY